jgi:uncharacterized membrane protein
MKQHGKEIKKEMVSTQNNFILLVYCVEILNLKIMITKNAATSYGVLILKVGVEESIVNAPRITNHGSAVSI